MRNCVQYLYVREQINQHSLVQSKIFQTILENIKTHRAGLYTFRINVLNSLTPLMNQLLSMSLLPRQQLHEIFSMVHLQQNGLQDRLSLAVPIQDILWYYETKLVTQVEGTESGLILTLAIPMASKSSYERATCHSYPHARRGYRLSNFEAPRSQIHGRP